MTPEQKDQLVLAANQVRTNAYAPYSQYKVGAAVRADNGRVYAGANVENASYGLAICAERSAVAQAISDGAKKISGVAVVTSTSPPAAPCGMCRQTLAEFGPDSLELVLVNDKGERLETTLGQLLPRAFRPDSLGK
jgi:cytidine deaminase